MANIEARVKGAYENHPELATFLVDESPDQRADREKKHAEFLQNIQNLEAKVGAAPENKRDGMLKALEKMQAQAEELSKPKQVYFADTLSTLILPFTKNGIRQKLLDILHAVSESDEHQNSLIERIKSSEGESKLSLQSELKEAKRKEGIIKDKLFKQCDSIQTVYQNLSVFLSHVNKLYKRAHPEVETTLFDVHEILTEAIDHVGTDVIQIADVIQ